MEVYVDVLDRRQLETPEAIESEMRGRTLATAEGVRALLESGALERAQEEVIDAVGDAYRTLIALKIASDASAGVNISNLRKFIGDTLAEVRREYKDGLGLVTESRAAATPGERTTKLRQASMAFRRGEIKAEELSYEVGRDLRSLVKNANQPQTPADGDPQEMRAVPPRDGGAAGNVGGKADLSQFDIALGYAAAARAEATAERKEQGIIPGRGLLEDPLVWRVVHAPECAWNKGVFNKTFASGTVGNSDIAIKMEHGAPGNYTLKGVRLDASKITQATFKALKSSIELAAALYGVPIPKASGAEVDPAEVAGNELISAEEQRRQAQFQRREIRRSTVALLDAVLAEKAGLSDPAKFKTASAHVRSMFAAYRPRLDPPAAPTP